MSGNFTPRISSDRFGNPFQLKFAAQVVNRKSGEVIENAYKQYFELGGQLYKVEVSKAAKTKDVKGVTLEGVWVKVTKVKKPAATSQRM